MSRNCSFMLFVPMFSEELPHGLDEIIIQFDHLTNSHILPDVWGFDTYLRPQRWIWIVLICQKPAERVTNAVKLGHK